MYQIERCHAPEQVHLGLVQIDSTAMLVSSYQRRQLV